MTLPQASFKQSLIVYEKFMLQTGNVIRGPQFDIRYNQPWHIKILENEKTDRDVQVSRWRQICRCIRYFDRSLRDVYAHRNAQFLFKNFFADWRY